MQKSIKSSRILSFIIMLIKKSKKAVCIAVMLVLLMSIVFALPHLGAEEPESGTASPAEELASEETIEPFSEEVSPVEKLLEIRAEPEVILPETEEEISGAALESEGEALTETAGDIALLAEESENTEEDEAIYVVASTLQCSTDGHGSITDWMLKGDANHDGKVDGSKLANGQGYLSDFNTDATILSGDMNEIVTVPHMESADFNDNGVIESFDWVYLVSMLEGAAEYPSALYHFRAVDTPAVGYHFANATVNGVTLTQENPISGNYHLTFDENGTATVTGLSLAENRVYFKHEPDSSPSDPEPCVKTFITLTSDCDENGSITDWMLKGDADHNGRVVGVDHINEEQSDFESVDGYEQTDLYKILAYLFGVPINPFHPESADVDGSGGINASDASNLTWLGTLNAGLSQLNEMFVFRVTDTPNSGYRVARVTVNGVVLTPDSPDSGSYHLKINENGIATVTGQSNPENNVYITHEPDGSEPVIPPLSGCKIQIPFTKTIIGENAPKEEFAFKIAALTEGAPMPAEDTVLMDGAGNGRFQEISYSSVGRYEYRITEVSGSAEGYTYDSSVYTVTVEVTNDEENGGLKAAIVKTVKDGGSDKLDAVIFENRYTAPQPKYGSLRISKTVTGELADKSMQFTFHIVLSDTSYNENGFANGEKDITLKHGESITISNIPAGTTYTITERGSEAYITTVDNNGTMVNGKEVSGTIVADTEAAVAYTNDLPYTPVVGVRTDSLPFIMLGLVALGSAMSFVFKKRKILGK